MIGIICFLIVLILILSYTTFNLLHKNEKLEDAVTSQQQYVDKLNETVTYCGNRIKEIDERGTFSSDDEIGWFFQEIKNMSNMLEKFEINK